MFLLFNLRTTSITDFIFAFDHILKTTINYMDMQIDIIIIL